MDDGHTAPCGLYCIDCIPSQRKLFESVRALKHRLNELRFEHYAELKARQVPPLADYSLFLKVLDAIESLECPAPCRNGGGSPGCLVKECIARQGFCGCWECREREHCDHLAPLLRVHPNLLSHLDLIAEYGPGAWAEHRGAHYRWGAPPSHGKGE